MDDLEETTPTTEEAEPTPTEEAKPTETEAKPTVRMYSQKELDTAVGKGSESINRQLSVSKAEVKKAEAKVGQSKAEQESLKAEIQEANAELDKLAQGIEDPMEREKLLSRIAIAKEKQKIASDKAKLASQQYEIETKDWQARMEAKAAELVRETGIDINEFVGCNTEADMEVKALRFQMNKKPEPEKEEGKPPKFASGVSSGAGLPARPTVEQLEKMTPEQYAEWAESRYK